MSDNITKFPAAPPKRDWITEPYMPERRVEIHGHQIPLLSAMRHDNGSVSLTLDRRFIGDFTNDADAFQAAVLIAHALAIGQGYSHLGAESKGAPFAPRSAMLESEPPK